MSAERLLHWAAELGDGTLDEFSSAHAWLLGAWVNPFRTLRTLVSLGQVEVDWTNRIWAATAPAITLLPDAAGHGLVAGARSDRLTRSLLESDLPEVYVHRFEQSQTAPDALFVATESEQDLQRFAAAMHLPYLHSAAERLASVIPTLDAMLASRRTAPIVDHFGVERFDLDLGWYPVDADDAPGLYQYELAGAPQIHLINDEAVRHRVNFAVGTWAEARRSSASNMLYYRADGANGTLDAPYLLPLPTLHGRAACLCTGLAPTEHGRGSLLYRNVPLRLAQLIASSLGQRLHEGHP